MQTTAVPNPEQFLDVDTVPFFIDGAWIESSSEPVIEDLHPATAKVLAHVASAGESDVNAAVSAARRAFADWARRTPRDRAYLLHRFADAIEQHQHSLAEIEARDLSKPIADVLAFDVLGSADCLRYFADIADHVEAREPIPVRGIEAEQRHYPRGVCGFIIPWNAPGSLMVWGIAPALAAGNTVVVKAPELAPLSCLFLCRLAEEVGFPPGVINVVPGLGQVAGAALARHPGLSYLSFTGSPKTGAQVAMAAAANLVPSKMELGGKGAAIVLSDVDIADTAEKLTQAIVRNAGQTCCTATRWLVEKPVYDEFVDAVSERMRSVPMGDEMDPSTVLGPLISQGQRNRVQNYLDSGVAQGATMLVEGGSVSLDGYEDGFFVRPALLSGDPGNVCAREEIFGPVAYVMPFSDADEAIRMTNDTTYGLANSVWSADVKRAVDIAGQLVAGNSWINAHNVFAYGLPYGGIGSSGWGGGVNSVKTFYDYLRPLTIARPVLV